MLAKLTNNKIKTIKKNPRASIAARNENALFV